MVRARARDRRRRHPRDGPHRADAAVGDDARRLQDAGQDRRGGARLVEDALALEAAGCFSIVLEAVPAPVAARSRERVAMPTIGIGAGADCDGQVLVYHDLLGLTEGHLPRFVKRYANLSREIRDALEAYAPTSAPARSRATSTRTRWRPRSSRSSRPPGARLPVDRSGPGRP